MKKTVSSILTILVIVLSLTVVATVLAQEGDEITDDQVNEVASELYCPVCENITLDTCETAACEDWRYEIELQLGEGKNKQEIKDDFVARFGDRVVGVPQDTALRNLSLVAPWLIIGALLVGGLITYLRWQQGQKAVVNQELARQPQSSGQTEDDYMSQLERDLSEK